MSGRGQTVTPTYRQVVEELERADEREAALRAELAAATAAIAATAFDARMVEMSEALHKATTELAAAKGREERLRAYIAKSECRCISCLGYGVKGWVCPKVAALAEKETGTSKQMCAAVTNLTQGPCELPSGHAGPHVGGREPGSES